MKDTFRKMKADIILSALLCTAIGIVLLVWPAQTIDVFCKVLAVGLIVIGAVNITSYFTNQSVFGGVLGMIVLLVGIWIFIRPESIVSLVPIVIGVILCVHAIQDLKLALESKEHGYEKWWSMMIIAAISLVFGVVCISNAFGMVKLALQFIGIALIYDGISALWISIKVMRTAREMKRETDALDVEYREVDEEK